MMMMMMIIIIIIIIIMVGNVRHASTTYGTLAPRTKACGRIQRGVGFLRGVFHIWHSESNATPSHGGFQGHSSEATVSEGDSVRRGGDNVRLPGL